MNLFRKNQSEELITKIDMLESQLTSFEKLVGDLTESNKQLQNDLIELTSKMVEKEEVIVEKEEVIENLTEQIEEKETVINEQTEVIQEVVENTMSVEKQAAIKAMEILSDCGVDAVETVEAPQTINILDEIKQLKGKELVEFYNKHKQNLPK